MDCNEAVCLFNGGKEPVKSEDGSMEGLAGCNALQLACRILYYIVLMFREREGESDQSLVQTEVRALTNSILNAADLKKDEPFPARGTTEIWRTLHPLLVGDEGGNQYS